jgi:hypothetical protein
MECHNKREVGLGEKTPIRNRNKHHLAKHTYTGFWVVDLAGNKEYLMFSDGEYANGKKRAEKNPEDIPSLREPEEKKGLVQGLIDFLTFK